MYDILSLFPFALKMCIYAHINTHQQPSLPVCAECAVEPHVHQAASQHDQPLRISLSADQRAVKQLETTESARAEHAQQHN